MSFVPLRGPRWRSQEGGRVFIRGGGAKGRPSLKNLVLPVVFLPSCPCCPPLVLLVHRSSSALLSLFSFSLISFFSSSLPSFLLFLAFSLISLLPSPHVRPPRRLACLPSPLVSLPYPSSLSSSEVEKTTRNHCQGLIIPSSQSSPSSLHHRRFCRSEQDRRSHLRGNGVC